jgi:hypothetical protein
LAFGRGLRTLLDEAKREDRIAPRLIQPLSLTFE